MIAKSDIQPILTEGRSKIEIETQEIIQSILDDYESGIQITQVQTQKADPPDQVIDAFRDVQAARADMERSKNEAEAYSNDVIPRARGEAAKILQAAEAYKKEVVAKAEGEASRFISIYNEYKNAKEVTQYIFLDQNPINGVSYYRLKQVESTGEYGYSKTIAVMNKKVLENFKVYPQPAKTSVTIEFESGIADTDGKVALLDVLGQKLREVPTEIVNGVNQVSLSLEGLPNGMYFISLSKGGEILHHNIKIIKGRILTFLMLGFTREL